MIRYICYRLLLVIPTLLGILLVNFSLVQFVPGGPVENTLAEFQGVNQTQLIASGTQDMLSQKKSSSQEMNEELIQELKSYYHFDLPVWQRFYIMLKQMVTFSFGESYFSHQSVWDMIVQALPVSASLGVLSTLLIYLVSIPLGIKRAMRVNSTFDVMSGLVLSCAYALPAFLVALLLLQLLASGSWVAWFPLRGLTSQTDLSGLDAVLDWLWHMALPVLSMSLGGFAALSFLTRNSFLEEVSKHYVLLAQAKGLSYRQTLRRHVFRNAMLIVIAGFPATLIGMFFTGSLMIEIIFSLKGLGLLGYKSLLNRDYPVVFASMYLFSLLGLLVGIFSDVCYALIDPRINFQRNQD